jgi:hypothetical protein
MFPVGMMLRYWSAATRSCSALFGHVPTAVAALIKDGIDGVLILTDDDENLKEIAARFTRATGRPVLRDLTEIPR